MTDKLKIAIEGDFDPKSAERQINEFGRKVAQANKLKYDPIKIGSADEVAKIVRKFEELLRVQTALNRRVNATNQKGTNFTDLDFDRMYSNQFSRNSQMRSVFERTVGNRFSGGQEQGRQPQSALGGMATNIAQSGLRAAGPAGGVAANALGTGMVSGAGAGLMGLVGGMLALGIGKVVGAVVEKIDAAQDNAVAMERLKRTIGDVNVSFNALKAVVNGTGDNLKLTYAETGHLTSQFVKAGNVKSGDFKSLGDELGVGVGMSRSFGLDPSEGVGVMGQMRGMKVTTNTQESRRFALLIGETIGKSDAFAKAGEVMSAVGDFATNQTRANMGVANVSGYAGAFSGLVGGGVPGLDPTGAAGLLSKVNAAIASGGAKGEASQFFSASIGAAQGLDPFQSRIKREQGAFGTNDSAFGTGSMARRFGITGPGGTDTNLQDQLAALKKQYGGTSNVERGMLAEATANHFGTSMAGAMALHALPANQMGDLSGRYGDISKFDASSIGNLAKIHYGTGDDRSAMAKILNARRDVSQSDKDRLNDAMSKNDVEAQKKILGELTAQTGQERNQGQDIRESRVQLDNLKTAMADRMLPMVDQMRQGIMFLAGDKGKLSPNEVMKGVIEGESRDRTNQIKGEFSARKKAAFGEVESLIGDRDEARISLDKKRDSMTASEIAKEMARIDAISVSIADAMVVAKKRNLELTDEENALLAKENKARDEKVQQLMSGPKLGALPSGAAAGGAAANESIEHFMKMGWTTDQSAGLAAQLSGESGFNAKAIGDGGKARGALQWHPDRQDEFKKRMGKDVLDSTLAEQREFMNFELREGNEKKAGEKLKKTTSPGEAGSSLSRNYVRPLDKDGAARYRSSLAERMAAQYKNSAPNYSNEGRNRGGEPVGSASVDITIRNPDGTTAAEPQKVAVRFERASPFGMAA